MLYKLGSKSENVTLIITNTMFSLKLTAMDTIGTSINVLYREVYLTLKVVTKY